MDDPAVTDQRAIEKDEETYDQIIKNNEHADYLEAEEDDRDLQNVYDENEDRPIEVRRQTSNNQVDHINSHYDDIDSEARSFDKTKLKRKR